MALSHPVVSPNAKGSATPESAWAAWRLGWALAVAAAAALPLAVFGEAPGRVLAALAAIAVPGLVGAAARPARPTGRTALIVLWAAAALVAAGLTGGFMGPFAIFLVTPVLASATLGWMWREGAGAAFVSLAALAVVQAAGRIGAPVQGAQGLWFAVEAAAMVLAFGAAGLIPACPIVAAPPAPDLELHARLTEAEAARERAEAEARGRLRFLANVSHELRTPLNAIMGFSDIMKQKLFGELPPRYAEYAELIHESGSHLLDLINDVLDASKIEADKYVLAKERFDAREAVQAALRMLRQGADDAGVRLRGVLPVEAVEVDADRRAIKQMVLNLASNALKFTPAGGSVTVTARQAAGALEIAVADTGVGISAEDLERLGRPYEQAGDATSRGQGTGLGLSLVKALARLHGGEMTIESRLGEGAAVTLRLPVLA